MAFSRRDFLKRTCCTAAAGFTAASFNRFGLVNALAQSTQDYKALVCVFLFGGNDSNNMVIPFSSSGYASYLQIRSVLALSQSSLLPIAPPSAGSFGFHPKFTELQALFNQKHLAVMANVGTLVRPTTRTQFQQGGATLPRNLFSHEDQQAQMQTATLDSNGQTGWAGRTADKIQSIYGGNFPIIISLAGMQYLLRGPDRPGHSVQRRSYEIALGLQQFGGIPEPHGGAAEPADFRYRRVSDPGGQHHHHQRPAGQQDAGGCSGGKTRHGHGLPQQRPGATN